MGRGERSNAKQRHRDRSLGTFCKGAHFAHRPGEQNAVSRQDHRPLGMIDQLERFAILRRSRTGCEAIIAVSGLSRIPIEFATCLLGIFSDIDQHRPWASRLCQPESFAHRRGEIFGSRD